MKLAFSTLGCPKWPVEEAVQAAVRFGYEAIEWRLADGELLNPGTPPTVKTRIVNATRQAGLKIACLDTSCQFVQATSEKREGLVQEAMQMVDMAAELGAPLLRVFGGAIPEGLSREELLPPTAEALGRVAAYAITQGITVSVETHDDWSKSEDIARLVETALKTGSVADAVRSGLAILWDVHHPYRMGEDPRQTLETLQKAGPISHVHIKDARRDPQAKNGWQLTLLEQGEVPVREAVKLLKEAGYEGYLSVEWEKKWHPEIEEPEVALPQHADLLRSYLAALD
jgi:sugar phosphate isomerase/epimerase